MDEIDRQLLALLRDNARTPVATLAKKLQVARGTVQNRMAKLERDGRDRRLHRCGSSRKSTSTASPRS